MNRCHCLCALHRQYSTVECQGAPVTTVTFSTAGGGVVPMCAACGQWWTDADPSPTSELQVTWSAALEHQPVAYFSPSLLYDALMKAGAERGVKGYRQLVHQAGVISPNTMTRMKHGGCPDATTLVRLLLWLGNTDIDAFIRYEDPT